MEEKSNGLRLSKIIKTLTPYLSAYPACKMKSSGLMVYARALQHIPLDELDAAMLKLMRTSKYFPTVAEILEAVRDQRKIISGNDVTGAGAAWKEAMDLVKNIGPYGHWTFSSSVVERTVKNFGKMELCNLKTDEMNTARAQFMRIYTSEEGRENGRREVKEALAALPLSQAAGIVNRLSAKMNMLGEKK
jgi:hypothetical protein